ncbi:hypothetical protein BGX30_009305 [Mortierella sp. GBA39]|nr:hypothetical protein BGX30_009305 [Mortierella sp. GBA39]
MSEENRERAEVRISVRPLVEYAFSSGDIDSGFRSATAMVEGTRIHQQVQKTYGEGDQKEVFLKREIPFGDLTYVIEGRCDGLIQTDDGWMIDEIKSTAASLDAMEGDGKPVHWAQAQVYAYIYAMDHGLDRMTVQLTYVETHTGTEHRFRRVLTLAELEAFVMGVLEIYTPYAALRLKNAHLRDESIRALPFPFDTYREGQRKLAGAVYQAVKEKRKLFAKAPTGIGKTMSTLFPSVKAIGEGLLGQIFYLTAKTITRTAAEQAFALMQAKGLRMQTVTITAKDKVCFQEETVCRKDACPFADGYYDRVNGAILDMLSQETVMDRAVIERYARKHQEQKRQTVLLVDEAHNLVDRGRDMFSAEIGKSAFLELKRGYKGVDAGVQKAADAVNKFFIELKKEMGEARQKQWQEQPRELGDPGLQEQLLDAYFASQHYIRIAKLYDERFLTYAEIHGGDCVLKLFCMDPSYLLAQAGKGFRSTVFFSATLSPLSYYRDMLGAGEEDYSLSVPSPFSREQLDVRIEPLSTRYRDRDDTRDALVKLLHGLISERKANYMVFFPSYQYMRMVVEPFAELHPEVGIIVQDTGMAEEERERFLAAFQADNADTLVGFAVLGGIFSEGIDLQGDRLGGVVVVGVGLPQLGFERNLIRDYFNENGKSGYDYAYVFPGMNKVLQAGGRLIRSEQDTGVLVLVDDRFLQRHYQGLLPDEWKGFTVGKP